MMPTPDERLHNPPVDLLWILAPPDNETYGAAGTMAWARDAGLRTAYICATRGEGGQIRVPGLATTQTLGTVREQDLCEVMSHVGLRELRMLSFRDSGMENSPDNEHPVALINRQDAVLTHLVRHIRELRPNIVTTFGPEGIYGHPDHVLIGKLAVWSVELTADPAWMAQLHTPWRVNALFFDAAPRERLLALVDDPSQPLGKISDQARNNLGTPSELISHWLDVTSWLSHKLRALNAHRTQVLPGEDGEELEAAMAQGLNREQYTRQPLPWDPDMSTPDPLTRARTEIGSAGPPAGLDPETGVRITVGNRDGRVRPDPETDGWTRPAYLVVGPITFDDQVWGVFSLSRVDPRHPFTE